MKSTKHLHIAIIADPLEKQNSGVYYYTLNLIEQLTRFDGVSLSVVVMGGEDGGKRREKGEGRKEKAEKRSEKGEVRRGKGGQTTTDYEHAALIEPESRIPKPVTHYHLPNVLGFVKDDPLRTFHTLPRLLTKINPDIVIEPAHFGPFNLPRHIKRVTVIHDLTPVKFPQFHRFHSQLLQRIFLQGILKRADLIVTNSENTKKDVIAYSPLAKDKTVFIYLGKDEMFKPKTGISLLSEHRIRQPYFLFVGTIEPRKNLVTLLEAFEQFKQKNQTNHTLVIVGGKGWKSAGFFKKLKCHPFRSEIILPGYVPRKELPALYAMADVFIYPSLYEGFGIPVLEAMACGKPVIASDTSSLPEVGGEAALYFNPNSVEELVGEMVLLANDSSLKEKLASKSLKQSEKFSWGKFGNEFVNLLEERFGEEQSKK